MAFEGLNRKNLAMKCIQTHLLSSRIVPHSMHLLYRVIMIMGIYN